MGQVRQWFSKVRFDGVEVLNVKGPLVVVNEALARTLMSLDPMIYQSSVLEIELKPW